MPATKQLVGPDGPNRIPDAEAFTGTERFHIVQETEPGSGVFNSRSGTMAQLIAASVGPQGPPGEDGEDGADGAGGPKTIRVLTEEDGVPGEYPLDDVTVYPVLEGDIGNGIMVPFAEESSPHALLLPVVPIGSEVLIIYGDPLEALNGPPNATPAELLVGAYAEESTDISLAIENGWPLGLQYGESATLIKAASMSYFEQTYHIWIVVSRTTVESGGGGGGGGLQPMDPAPDSGTVLIADGAGGLSNSGVALEDLAPVATTLAALKPAADAVGQYGHHQGSADGFIASVTLRLLDLPAGEETVAGNFAVGSTSGGWGHGVNATGFVFTAARADGALQTLPQTGLTAFASYSVAELLTRTFVMTMVVVGEEMRCFVNDILVGVVPLAGGYKPATSPTSRLTIHVNSGGTPRHASAAEFCALFYVDPTIADLGGYTDAHASALFRGALNNAGVYTGLNGAGDVYAVSAMVDGDPYSYMHDLCSPASVVSLYVMGTAPHRGRGAMARW